MRIYNLIVTFRKILSLFEITFCNICMTTFQVHCTWSDLFAVYPIYVFAFDYLLDYQFECCIMGYARSSGEKDQEGDGRGAQGGRGQPQDRQEDGRRRRALGLPPEAARGGEYKISMVWLIRVESIFIREN